MSIEINTDICIGCASCAEICPGSLIRMVSVEGLPAAPALAPSHARTYQLIAEAMELPAAPASQSSYANTETTLGNGSSGHIGSSKSRPSHESADAPSASTRKAHIPHPERCWGCASCVKECPIQAISLYLGEDMGGRGGRMSARRDGTKLHWTVRKADGATVTVTTDSRSANRY
ncbi:MAG: 4Fe-4S binding protein [Lachnospiraceae bacterium]|jgi:adenylylsulfate reductase subunit B|nr:4Fe-4S binding protein [Lachnospiraceae bacterium]